MRKNAPAQGLPEFPARKRFDSRLPFDSHLSQTNSLVARQGHRFNGSPVCHHGKLNRERPAYMHSAARSDEGARMVIGAAG
jgi:hypothetical protein